MTVTSLVRTALLGAALLAAPQAWAAASDSKDFIAEAIRGNLAEIALGKLAVQKSSTPGVKALGQLLMDDHNKANQDATAAAKTLGIAALPTAPSDPQKTLHDKLANEPGKMFDTDFVNAMLQDHQTVITNYEAAAANDKDAAGQYATTTLPSLRKHMEEVTKLAKSLGI